MFTLQAFTSNLSKSDILENYSKEVRRKDRQQADPAFLKDLLNGSVSCTIAIERDGYPLNHVAFFAYDETNHEIVFHFSKHGFASEEITNDKKVCISVYKYGKLYTAKRAVDFGCEYQSVIIYGTLRILVDQTERMKAMALFFDKFFKQVAQDRYDSFTDQDAKPIHVARIKIDDWFGKEHRVPPFANDSFYPAQNAIIK
jgi:nitroimidazol reductase NimA-like FMN-containing flavoprotein (pyridoxamine 5'-phosphate oxidase superfamily)